MALLLKPEENEVVTWQLLASEVQTGELVVTTVLLKVLRILSTVDVACFSDPLLRPGET